MRTVVQQRHAYGAEQHRFHPGLWDLAKHYGFTPRLCRPYRAKTKGKVERFIGYLRHSFYVPLLAQLKQAGLGLDAETANLEVLKWLRDVANVRTHQGIQAVPLARWELEKALLQGLAPSAGPTPRATPAATPPKPQRFAPVDLQHPLSIYEALLEEVAP